ncbi:MAG: thiamine-phosphate kinase [Thermoprotei archaeon]
MRDIVASLGERGIIEYAWSIFSKHPKELMGHNDDVVALRINNKFLVFHTDVLVESCDVLPGMTPYQIGRKSIVMNISDLASKSVKPEGILISLGLPKTYKKRDLAMLFKGIEEASRKYNSYILGGDTSESSELFIAVFVYGITDFEPPKRSNAKPGDIVAVTGLFGLTSIAYKILLEKNMKVMKSTAKEALRSVYYPNARLMEGLALKGLVSASMDVSDGLAFSLHTIAEMSNVGIKITNVPLHPLIKKFAKDNKLDPIDLIFYNGGEEYELLVTIPPNKWNDAVTNIKNIGGTLIEIGKITHEKKVTAKIGKKYYKIEKKGWSHFKTWNYI